MRNSVPPVRCAALALAAIAIIAVSTSSPVRAGDIIADWAMAKTPPAPELKPVTVDGKTTALLILDMMKGNCAARPRCLATVPAIKKLMDAARAADAMVFYTLVAAGNATPADMVDPGIAAHEGEWVFQRGPDKFLGSGLDERLKARTAQGAVVGVSSGAAQRGYKVIVPVDGMSAEDAY